MVKKKTRAEAAAIARQARLSRLSSRHVASETTQPVTLDNNDVSTTSSTSAQMPVVDNRRSASLRRTAGSPITMPAASSTNLCPVPATRQLLVPQGGMKPKRQIIHKYIKSNGEIPEVQQEKRKRGRPPKKTTVAAAIACTTTPATAHGSANFQDLFVTHVRQQQLLNYDCDSIDASDVAIEESQNKDLESTEVISEDTQDASVQEDEDDELSFMEDISQSDENVIRIIEIVEEDEEEDDENEEMEQVMDSDEDAQADQELFDIENDIGNYEVVVETARDEEDTISVEPDLEQSQEVYVMTEENGNSQEEVEIIPYDEAYNTLVEVEVVTEENDDDASCDKNFSSHEYGDDSSESNSNKDVEAKVTKIESLSKKDEKKNAAKPFKRTERVVTRRSRLLQDAENQLNDPSPEIRFDEVTVNLFNIDTSQESTSIPQSHAESQDEETDPSPIVVHKKYGRRSLSKANNDACSSRIDVDPCNMLIKNCSVDIKITPFSKTIANMPIEEDKKDFKLKNVEIEKIEPTQSIAIVKEETHENDVEENVHKSPEKLMEIPIPAEKTKGKRGRKPKEVKETNASDISGTLNLVNSVKELTNKEPKVTTNENLNKNSSILESQSKSIDDLDEIGSTSEEVFQKSANNNISEITLVNISTTEDSPKEPPTTDDKSLPAMDNKASPNPDEIIEFDTVDAMSQSVTPVGITKSELFQDSVVEVQSIKEESIENVITDFELENNSSSMNNNSAGNCVSSAVCNLNLKEKNNEYVTKSDISNILKITPEKKSSSSLNESSTDLLASEQPIEDEKAVLPSAPKTNEPRSSSQIKSVSKCATEVPSKEKGKSEHQKNGHLKTKRSSENAKKNKSKKDAIKLEKKLKKIEEKSAKKEERERLKHEKKLAKEIKKREKKSVDKSARKQKKLPPVTESSVNDIRKRDDFEEKSWSDHGNDSIKKTSKDSTILSQWDLDTEMSCQKLYRTDSLGSKIDISYDSLPHSLNSQKSSRSLDSPSWEYDESNGLSTKYNSCPGSQSVSDNSNDKLEPKSDNCIEPSDGDADGNIRRSGRIRTIKQTRRRSHGHGLVDKELASHHMSVGSNYLMDDPILSVERAEKLERDMIEAKSLFTEVTENEYKCERYREEEMTCECFLTADEIERNELGCGEVCLNRILLIECGPKCTVGERCTNNRFQQHRYSKCRVFKTDKKGFGIMGASTIPAGEFIMEYVGEVLNAKQFEKRASDYSKDKNKHYYFMALNKDCIIDATSRGNISRFINHSCNPNAETQKWTVNGELRVGFFSKRAIHADEEITFDYKFQRYGKEAQRCYCESHNCRGWIGEEPQSDNDDDDEDDDEDEAKSISDDDTEAAENEEKSSVESLENEEEEEKSLITAKAAKKKAAPKIRKSDAAAPKKPKQKKLHPKRRVNRPQIFVDSDLDNDILELEQSGLKNQAQTLKFSRVMVTAKLQLSQSKLLSILRRGEASCRRLFLDYNGLSLLHGWMNTPLILTCRQDLEFRLSILKTLQCLPIPNKTMLKDSKVFATVEKWSQLGVHNEGANTSESVDEQKLVKIEPMEEGEKPSEIIIKSEKPKVDVSADCEVKNLQEESVTKESEVIEIKKETQENCSIITEESAPLLPKSESELATNSSEEVSNEEKLKHKIPQLLKDYSAIQNIDLDSLKMIISINEKNQQAIQNANEENRDIIEEIRCLASTLIAAWVNLPEVFRIPKKERIEQMKEHEREANQSSLQALELSEQEQKHILLKNNERFREKESLEIEKNKPRLASFIGGIKRPLNIPLIGSNPGMNDEHTHQSKMMRRRMFEARVAEQKEEERRRTAAQLMHFHRSNFFKLDPRRTPHLMLPYAWNQDTNEFYNNQQMPIQAPPTGFINYPLEPRPPMPTNPDQYSLPPMDLPPYWTYNITPTGRIFYYHLKIRISQWDPPIKLSLLKDTVKDSKITDNAADSDSNDSVCSEPPDSDECMLQQELDTLKEKYRKDNLNSLVQEIQAMAGDDVEPVKAADDSVKTEATIEVSDSRSRKRKRHEGLVEVRVISPLCEEERIRVSSVFKRYKEHKKEKKRREQQNLSSQPSSSTDGPRKVNKLTDGLPLPSASTVEPGDEEDINNIAASSINSSIALENEEGDIIVSGFTDKIVDELDDMKRERELRERAKLNSHKRSKGSDELKVSTKKRRVGDDGTPAASVSEEARRIKDKFRSEISGVIVHHLNPYLKESCTVGRICNNEDFKHLARKLTHFVMLKELKHRDNTVNTLEVTDSVKLKSREFIKKYMTKYGAVYKRPDNEPEYH